MIDLSIGNAFAAGVAFMVAIDCFTSNRKVLGVISFALFAANAYIACF